MRTKYDISTLRMMAESRQQIVENYNMGFITLYEYYCQILDTYTWVNGKRWQWHLMCLTPSWPFRLYEKAVAFCYRLTHRAR